MLQEGTKLPEFTAQNQNGETIRSTDLIGQKLVLYFYPEDDTPVCTVQACNIRDNYARYLAQGFTVFGISPNSAESHRKFIEKYDLPFSLLADEDLTIANLFGAYGEKNMYGNIVMGIKRSTFVVNKQGIIEKVVKRALSKTHTEQVLGK